MPANDTVTLATDPEQVVYDWGHNQCQDSTGNCSFTALRNESFNLKVDWIPDID